MNRKGWIRIAVIVLCSGVMLYSGYRLADYFLQNERTRQLNEENQRLMETSSQMTSEPTEEVTLTPEPSADIEASLLQPSPTLRSFLSVQSEHGPTVPPVQNSLQELHRKYPDVVGYLKVDCIDRIDFAVVQRNNTFYLNHDMTGSKNVTGAAFLEESCKTWPRSENLVIYAHNMKSGEMFGKLHQMLNRGILASNPLVHYSTLYGEETYIPFFIGKCAINEVPFYRVSFSGEEDFNVFLLILKKNSGIEFSTDVQYGDDLLTLVTCCDDSDDHRLVVMLRKIRDGENVNAAKKTIFPMV